MPAAFQTVSALASLEAYRSIAQGPYFSARELLAPAAIPLQLFPETWVHWRGLELGLGDPATHYRLLRGRMEWAAERIERQFPDREQAYGFEDILERLGESLASTHLLAACQGTGNPYIPSEDLPILLGGVFTFADGARMWIPFDARLSRAHPAAPLSFDVPVFNSKGPALCPTPLKDRWHKMRTYLNQHQDLARKSRCSELSIERDSLSYRRGDIDAGFQIIQKASDPDQRFETAFELTDPTRSLDYHSVSTYERPAKTAGRRKNRESPAYWRNQFGLLLETTSGDEPTTFERWEIRDEAKDHSALLDPSQSQFFFLPGAVWMIRGAPSTTAEALPLRRLAELIRDFKRELRNPRGELTPGEGATVTITDFRNPFYAFAAHFGDQSRTFHFEVEERTPEGLPSRWHLKVNGSMHVRCLPVDEETVEGVQNFIEGGG